MPAVFFLSECREASQMLRQSDKTTRDETSKAFNACFCSWRNKLSGWGHQAYHVVRSQHEYWIQEVSVAHLLDELHNIFQTQYVCLCLTTFRYAPWMTEYVLSCIYNC